MFKVKHERTADCVVAGYRLHKSGPDRIGSLLLGLYTEAGELASVGVVGAFPMARRKELFAELQPLVTTFEGHPWNWARAPAGGAATPGRRSTAGGTRARTCRSCRCARNGWSRCATTTWKAAGSGTPPSSSGGARTVTRARAPTSSWRNRSTSTWPRSSAGVNGASAGLQQITAEQETLVFQHVGEGQPGQPGLGAALHDPARGPAGQHRADRDAQLVQQTGRGELAEQVRPALGQDPPVAPVGQGLMAAPRSACRSPAMITSACSAACLRTCAGADRVVITMVRASPGAAVSSGLSRSRSSCAVSTAMGGVAGRPARSAAQRGGTRPAGTVRPGPCLRPPGSRRRAPGAGRRLPGRPGRTVRRTARPSRRHRPRSRSCWPAPTAGRPARPAPG